MREKEPHGSCEAKTPVTSHINTIMDYTFYWFLGIYDYYMYTGDRHFRGADIPAYANT